MASPLITVAETPVFARQAERVWSGAQREESIDYISGDPEAGDLIPDTGGVRKVRWSTQGSGKRGGARVIYFYHDSSQPLYLLMVYTKARKEDLSADEERTLRDLVSALKRTARARAH